MTILRTVLLITSLTLSASVVAQEQRGTVVFRHGPDIGGPASGTLPLTAWGPGSLMSSPVMGRLFPPTLIMQRQKELALTDQQQEAIKTELREFQSRVVDVQWDLQSSQGDLEAILAEETIDADAAGTAIDRVLAAENALKKLHLGLLIRIRNALNPDQVARLEESLTRVRRFDGFSVPAAPLAPPGP